MALTCQSNFPVVRLIASMPPEGLVTNPVGSATPFGRSTGFDGGSARTGRTMMTRTRGTRAESHRSCLIGRSLRREVLEKVMAPYFHFTPVGLTGPIGIALRLLFQKGTRGQRLWYSPF